MNRYCSNKFVSMLVLVMLILTTLPLGATASTTSASQANPGIEVEPELMAQIEADETTGYLIYFRERADLSPAYEMNWSDRGWFVYESLTSTADRSQARVREYLSQQGADFQVFWIDNVIAVESSDYGTFNGLPGFPEIEALRARRQAILYEPVEPSPSGPSPEVVEPNIVHVGAPAVWAMGHTGQGIVVANIDTGVRYTHEALVNQYRGNLGGVFDHNYNWWDPADGGQDLVPTDWHSHGSHTMGTILGDDGGDNQVGMAPGARWIACQDFETSDNDNELLECGQFMAAPWDLTGANPNPDLRPHIVNNSWGDCLHLYDNWYMGVIDAWLAAGVYPVFANGNNTNCSYPEPPGCHTVGNPARYGNVTGVGSTGRDDGQYAIHSNWGPTDNPDTINPLGYPNLKPQVMAPGVNIRSCYRDGDTAYGTMGGTSMSAPHVAGLIALMWSAAPCLVGDYAHTETIIQQTATAIPYASNCGGEPPGNVPNFATGWGEINALAAVQAAINFCGEVGWLDGHVYDAATLAPIENALVDAEEGSDLTDPNGYYTITLLAGTYDVEASHALYTATMATGIVVTTGSVTTVDFTLQPRGQLFGYVTDADTSAPLDALVTADDGTSTNTDPATGYYEMYLDAGTYVVTATAQDYAPDSAVVNLVAGQDTRQDFALLAAILFEPSPLHVTVTWQATYNMAATLTSRLAAPYDFEFRELPGGLVPLALGMEGWNEYLPPRKAPASTEVAHNSDLVIEGRGRLPFVHHGTTPQQFNIIVYSDDDYSHSPAAVEQALNALGLTYTFYGYDPNGIDLILFRDAVNMGGWDLVVLEHNHFTFLDASEYTAVERHVTGGGMAIVDSWAISLDPTHLNHALWAAMGAQYAAGIASSPQPLYWWDDAHPLFTYPESVPEFTSLNNPGWLNIYGARMTLLGDPSTGLGGFTTDPQPAQAGVILRDDNKTIYKGLIDIVNEADLDSDGIRDVAEWWINALSLVLYGPVADMPWFGQDPVSGTVPAQGSIHPTMSFTATPSVGVTQPGDYYCGFRIDGDPAKEVRVTMTVEPGANMGQVQGYVADNHTGDPVEAVIDIAGGDPMTQTTSDPNTGYYSTWLVSGTYRLDFSAAGYLPFSDTVGILAGQTTSLDVSMIPVFHVIYLPLTLKGYTWSGLPSRTDERGAHRIHSCAPLFLAR